MTGGSSNRASLATLTSTGSISLSDITLKGTHTQLPGIFVIATIGTLSVSDITITNLNLTYGCFRITNGASFEANNILLKNTSNANSGTLVNSTYGKQLIVKNSDFSNAYASNEGTIVNQFRPGDYALIENCTFSNTTSINVGGALSIRDMQHLKIHLCTFFRCHSKSHSGAIHCVNETMLTVTNCSFRECSASGYHGTGAFIVEWVAACYVAYNNFTSCFATTGNGGAMTVWWRNENHTTTAADYKIEYCYFRNNTAAGYANDVYSDANFSIYVNDKTFHECYSFSDQHKVILAYENGAKITQPHWLPYTFINVTTVPGAGVDDEWCEYPTHVCQTVLWACSLCVQKEANLTYAHRTVQLLDGVHSSPQIDVGTRNLTIRGLNINADGSMASQLVAEELEMPLFKVGTIGNLTLQRMKISVDGSSYNTHYLEVNQGWVTLFQLHVTMSTNLQPIFVATNAYFAIRESVVFDINSDTPQALIVPVTGKATKSELHLEQATFTRINNKQATPGIVTVTDGAASTVRSCLFEGISLINGTCLGITGAGSILIESTLFSHLHSELTSPAFVCVCSNKYSYQLKDSRFLRCTSSVDSIANFTLPTSSGSVTVSNCLFEGNTAQDSNDLTLSSAQGSSKAITPTFVNSSSVSYVNHLTYAGLTLNEKIPFPSVIYVTKDGIDKPFCWSELYGCLTLKNTTDVIGYPFESKISVGPGEFSESIVDLRNRTATIFGSGQTTILRPSRASSGKLVTVNRGSLSVSSFRFLLSSNSASVVFFDSTDSDLTISDSVVQNGEYATVSYSFISAVHTVLSLQNVHFSAVAFTGVPLLDGTSLVSCSVEECLFTDCSTTASSLLSIELSSGSGAAITNSNFSVSSGQDRIITAVVPLNTPFRVDGSLFELTPGIATGNEISLKGSFSKNDVSVTESYSISSDKPHMIAPFVIPFLPTVIVSTTGSTDRFCWANTPSGCSSLSEILSRHGTGAVTTFAVKTGSYSENTLVVQQKTIKVIGESTNAVISFTDVTSTKVNGGSLILTTLTFRKSSLTPITFVVEQSSDVFTLNSITFDLTSTASTTALIDVHSAIDIDFSHTCVKQTSLAMSSNSIFSFDSDKLFTFSEYVFPTITAGRFITSEYSSDLSVSQTTMTSLSSTLDGCSINFVSSGSLTLDEITFSGSQSNPSSKMAAVFAKSGSVLITNSRFVDLSCNQGALVADSFKSFVVRSSTFIRCSSSSTHSATIMLTGTPSASPTISIDHCRFDSSSSGSSGKDFFASNTVMPYLSLSSFAESYSISNLDHVEIVSQPVNHSLWIPFPSLFVNVAGQDVDECQWNEVKCLTIAKATSYIYQKDADGQNYERTVQVDDGTYSEGQISISGQAVIVLGNVEDKTSVIVKPSGSALSLFSVTQSSTITIDSIVFQHDSPAVTLFTMSGTSLTLNNIAITKATTSAISAPVFSLTNGQTTLNGVSIDLDTFAAQPIFSASSTASLSASHLEFSKLTHQGGSASVCEWASTGSCQISHSSFVECVGTETGVIHVSSGSVSLTSCRFARCSSRNGGGAITATESSGKPFTLTLEDCFFEKNTKGVEEVDVSVTKAASTVTVNECYSVSEIPILVNNAASSLIPHVAWPIVLETANDDDIFCWKNETACQSVEHGVDLCILSTPFTVQLTAGQFNEKSVAVGHKKAIVKGTLTDGDVNSVIFDAREDITLQPALIVVDDGELTIQDLQMNKVASTHLSALLQMTGSGVLSVSNIAIIPPNSATTAVLHSLLDIQNGVFTITSLNPRFYKVSSESALVLSPTHDSIITSSSFRNLDTLSADAGAVKAIIKNARTLTITDTAFRACTAVNGFGGGLQLVCEGTGSFLLNAIEFINNDALSGVNLFVVAPSLRNVITFDTLKFIAPSSVFTKTDIALMRGYTNGDTTDAIPLVLYLMSIGSDAYSDGTDGVDKTLCGFSIYPCQSISNSHQLLIENGTKTNGKLDPVTIHLVSPVSLNTPIHPSDHDLTITGNTINVERNAELRVNTATASLTVSDVSFVFPLTSDLQSSLVSLESGTITLTDCQFTSQSSGVTATIPTSLVSVLSGTCMISDGSAFSRLSLSQPAIRQAGGTLSVQSTSVQQMTLASPFLSLERETTTLTSVVVEDIALTDSTFIASSADSVSILSSTFRSVTNTFGNGSVLHATVGPGQSLVISDGTAAACSTTGCGGVFFVHLSGTGQFTLTGTSETRGIEFSGNTAVEDSSKGTRTGLGGCLYLLLADNAKQYKLEKASFLSRGATDLGTYVMLEFDSDTSSTISVDEVIINIPYDQTLFHLYQVYNRKVSDFRPLVLYLLQLTKGYMNEVKGVDNELCGFDEYRCLSLPFMVQQLVKRSSDASSHVFSVFVTGDCLMNNSITFSDFRITVSPDSKSESDLTLVEGGFNMNNGQFIVLSTSGATSSTTVGLSKLGLVWSNTVQNFATIDIGLLEIVNCGITMQQPSIVNTQPMCVVSGGTIVVENCVFNFNQKSAGSFFSTTAGAINLAGCSFGNATLTDALIKGTGNLNILTSTFDSLTSASAVSFTVNPSQTLKITGDSKQSEFKNIQSSQNGGAVSATLLGTATVIIEYTTFTNCGSSQNGGAVYLDLSQRTTGVYSVDHLTFGKDSSANQCGEGKRGRDICVVSPVLPTVITTTRFEGSYEPSAEKLTATVLSGLWGTKKDGTDEVNMGTLYYHLVPYTSGDLFVNGQQGFDYETCGLAPLPCKTLNHGYTHMKLGSTLYLQSSCALTSDLESQDGETAITSNVLPVASVTVDGSRCISVKSGSLSLLSLNVIVPSTINQPIFAVKGGILVLTENVAIQNIHTDNLHTSSLFTVEAGSLIMKGSSLSFSLPLTLDSSPLISQQQGKVHLQGCKIENVKRQTGNGAVISAFIPEFSSLIIESCSFVSCVAQNGAGGAISAEIDDNGELIMNGTTPNVFTSCSASTLGGSIHIKTEWKPPVLSSLTFVPPASPTAIGTNIFIESLQLSKIVIPTSFAFLTATTFDESHLDLYRGYNNKNASDAIPLVLYLMDVTESYVGSSGTDSGMCGFEIYPCKSVGTAAAMAIANSTQKSTQKFQVVVKDSGIHYTTITVSGYALTLTSSNPSGTVSVTDGHFVIPSTAKTAGLKIESLTLAWTQKESLFLQQSTGTVDISKSTFTFAQTALFDSSLISVTGGELSLTQVTASFNSGTISTFLSVSSKATVTNCEFGSASLSDSFITGHGMISVQGGSFSSLKGRTDARTVTTTVGKDESFRLGFDVAQTTFSACSSTSNGGALSIIGTSNGIIAVTNVLFKKCSTSAFGGAAWIDIRTLSSAGSFSVLSCSFGQGTEANSCASTEKGLDIFVLTSDTARDAAPAVWTGSYNAVPSNTKFYTASEKESIWIGIEDSTFVVPYASLLHLIYPYPSGTLFIHPSVDANHKFCGHTYLPCSSIDFGYPLLISPNMAASFQADSSWTDLVRSIDGETLITSTGQNTVSFKENGQFVVVEDSSVTLSAIVFKLGSATSAPTSFKVDGGSLLNGAFDINSGSLSLQGLSFNFNIPLSLEASLIIHTGGYLLMSGLTIGNISQSNGNGSVLSSTITPESSLTILSTHIESCSSTGFGGAIHLSFDSADSYEFYFEELTFGDEETTGIRGRHIYVHGPHLKSFVEASKWTSYPIAAINQQHVLESLWGDDLAEVNTSLKSCTLLPFFFRPTHTLNVGEAHFDHIMCGSDDYPCSTLQHTVERMTVQEEINSVTISQSVHLKKTVTCPPIKLSISGWGAKFTVGNDGSMLIPSTSGVEISYVSLHLTTTSSRSKPVFAVYGSITLNQVQIGESTLRSISTPIIVAETGSSMILRSGGCANLSSSASALFQSKEETTTTVTSQGFSGLSLTGSDGSVFRFVRGITQLTDLTFESISSTNGNGAVANFEIDERSVVSLNLITFNTVSSSKGLGGSLFFSFSAVPNSLVLNGLTFVESSARSGSCIFFTAKDLATVTTSDVFQFIPENTVFTKSHLNLYRGYNNSNTTDAIPLVLYLTKMGQTAFVDSQTGRDVGKCGFSIYPCSQVHTASTHLVEEADVETENQTFEIQISDCSQRVFGELEAQNYIVTHQDKSRTSSNKLSFDDNGCVAIGHSAFHSRTVSFDQLTLVLSSTHSVGTFFSIASGSVSFNSCLLNAGTSLPSSLIDMTGGNLSVYSLLLSNTKASVPLFSLRSFTSVSISSVSIQSVTAETLIFASSSGSDSFSLSDSEFVGTGDSFDQDTSDVCSWSNGFVHINRTSAVITNCSFSNLSQGALSIETSATTISNSKFSENTVGNPDYSTPRRNIRCDKLANLTLSSIKSLDGTTESPSTWIDTHSGSCSVFFDSGARNMAPLFVPTVSAMTSNEKKDLLSVEITGTTFVPCGLAFEIFEYNQTTKKEGQKETITLNMSTLEWNESRIAFSFNQSRTLTVVYMDKELWGRLRYGTELSQRTAQFFLKLSSQAKMAEANTKNWNWLIPLIISLTILATVAAIILALVLRRRKKKEIEEDETKQMNRPAPLSFAFDPSGGALTPGEYPKAEQWGDDDEDYDYDSEDDDIKDEDKMEVMMSSYPFEMKVMNRQNTLYSQVHFSNIRFPAALEHVYVIASGLIHLSEKNPNHPVFKYLTSHAIVIEGNGNIGLNLNEESLSQQKLDCIRWQAPEVSDTHQPDAKSMVFSLGLVLFEMVTGELPYPELDASGAQRAIRAKQLPAIDLVDDEAVVKVLNLMLTFDPAERPSLASVQAMITSGTLASPMQPLGTARTRRSRRGFINSPSARSPLIGSSPLGTRRQAYTAQSPLLKRSSLGMRSPMGRRSPMMKGTEMSQMNSLKSPRMPRSMKMTPNVGKSRLRDLIADLKTPRISVTLEKQLPPVAEHPKVVNDKWYDAKHDITWARQPTASLSLTASRPAPFPFHVPEDNMYKPKHDVVEKKLGKRISLGKQAGRDLTTDTKPLNDKFYSTDNQHKHHLNSTSFVTHSNPRQLTAGNLANDLDFVISHADRQCAQIDRLLAQYSDTFQTTGFSTP
ncbi:hypothetical protein BLNAU_19569 [Blattamonas nauphoetae]|uniref:Protein kinase domain-containing protein n=1 Tax=Blattamonas nauphoetae TaxID=2049346 RepID=A0ABQ9X123_9EUKA|nr:hypothetical protein BLNAU_19569 [Blattamonas nauphoetae]